MLLKVIIFSALRLFLPGGDEGEDALAGQLVGVAAQSQPQGQPGQVLPAQVGVQHLGGAVQGQGELLVEGGVQQLRVVAGAARLQQGAGVPDGEDLLEGADGGEVTQMGLAVLLALRPGQEAVLDIVVHHGRGQGLAAVIGDELAGDVGDDLVHVEADVGEAVPHHGALLLQPALEFLQFLHRASHLSSF